MSISIYTMQINFKDFSLKKQLYSSSDKITFFGRNIIFYSSYDK